METRRHLSLAPVGPVDHSRSEGEVFQNPLLRFVVRHVRKFKNGGTYEQVFAFFKHTLSQSLTWGEDASRRAKRLKSPALHRRVSWSSSSTNET